MLSLQYYNVCWFILFLIFCFSPDKVGELTEQMVGYNLKTKQTPPDGVFVKKVKKCVAQHCSFLKTCFISPVKMCRQPSILPPSVNFLAVFSMLGFTRSPVAGKVNWWLLPTTASLLLCCLLLQNILTELLNNSRYLGFL